MSLSWVFYFWYMKRFLHCVLLLLITAKVSAQENDSLRFRISIDSCKIGSTTLNSVQKKFYLTVKNSSEVFPLFNKDGKELGIRLYVNRIMEDSNRLVIVKHLFMQKEDGIWKLLTASDYYVAELYANTRKVTVGSDKTTPDLYIEFSISRSDGYDFTNDKTETLPTDSVMPPKRKKKN